jgi:hypothetical protein
MRTTTSCAFLSCSAISAADFQSLRDSNRAVTGIVGECSYLYAVGAINGAITEVYEI